MRCEGNAVDHPSHFKAVSDPVKEYWEARLRRQGGLRGVGHISRSQTYNAWAYRLKRRAFRRALRRIDVPTNSAEVLDVGSGTGFGVEEWRRAGARAVTGSDLTLVALEHLRARFPDTPFVELDIGGELPEWAQARFDVVSAFEVLFHIVDDSRYADAFANVSRLLRPGGYFVFTENLLRHRTERAQYQVSRRRSDVESVARSVGFVTVWRVPLFVVMGFPVDVKSRRLQELWRRSIGECAKSERWGQHLGRALFAVDCVLTAWLSSGPSVELVVVQKRL